MSRDVRAWGPLHVMSTAVLVVVGVQHSVVPVMAPLSRELELPDWALGVLMTSTAAMFALASGPWGRAVDRLGVRAVMIRGLLLSLVGSLLFVVICEAALRGAFSPEVALTLMVLTRALAFGAGTGAIPTAALAWVAAHTAVGPDRVGGMARIGAMQGLAQVMGPGAAFVLAAAGVIAPLWAAPFLMGASLLLVLRALPRHTGPRPSERGAAHDITDHVPLTLRERRLRPAFVAGFSANLTLGIVMVCLGFVVQDRLHLDGSDAAQMAGLVSSVMGLCMLFVQGGVVPRAGLKPLGLVSVGLPLMLVGVAGIGFAASTAPLLLAAVLLAAGMGFVSPGFVSMPSMLVPEERQGQAAGLVQTVTGLAYMVGPLLGSVLYSVDDRVPFLVAVSLCATASLFLWRVRSVTRRTGQDLVDAR